MELTDEEILFLKEKYHLKLTQLYRMLYKYPATSLEEASRQEIDKVENRIKDLGVEKYIGPANRR